MGTTAQPTTNQHADLSGTPPKRSFVFVSHVTVARELTNDVTDHQLTVVDAYFTGDQTTLIAALPSYPRLADVADEYIRALFIDLLEEGFAFDAQADGSLAESLQMLAPSTRHASIESCEVITDYDVVEKLIAERQGSDVPATPTAH